LGIVLFKKLFLLGKSSLLYPSVVAFFGISHKASRQQFKVGTIALQRVHASNGTGPSREDKGVCLTHLPTAADKGLKNNEIQQL
jgi:hypothetical protein